MSLLKIENLSVVDVRNSEKIIQNVNFSLEPNSCLGIVGESGSGKSMTCRAILNLTHPWLQVKGRILLHGEDINGANTMEKVRGKNISMVLQDPMTAFDPIYTIGFQIRETLMEKLRVSKRDAMEMGLDAMVKMGIDDAPNVYEKYPHQLSGGMLQRCMIAISLAMKPDVIIADEPTTALDAINQRDVVDQLEKLQHAAGTAIIFVSHDLGVVQRIAQQVLVMKEGTVVAYGETSQIFREAVDQYTQYLVKNRLALSEPFQRLIRGEAKGNNAKSKGSV